MMSPLSIYQEALDIVSSAILTGDFPTFISMFDLPYLMRTTTTDFVLQKPEELEPTFRALVSGLKRRGVTHYERIARNAQFHRSDRIVGHHWTHMISNGERIDVPHHCGEALVRREGSIWRFSESVYPLTATQWPLTEEQLFRPKPKVDLPMARLLS